MATSTIIGIQDHGVTVPRSTDNGLWNASASRVTHVPAMRTSLVVLDVFAVRSCDEPAVQPAA